MAYQRKDDLVDSGDVFAVPGANSIIDIVLSDDRSAINGLTLSELRDHDNNPAITRMTFDEWLAQAAARQLTPITWEPTTSQHYHEMLEVLPPLAWTGDAFCVGEATDHCFATGKPRYQGYRYSDGRYQVTSRPVTLAEFRSVVRS